MYLMRRQMSIVCGRLKVKSDLKREPCKTFLNYQITFPLPSPRTMTSAKKLQALQEVIWNGSLPLEIRLSPSECRIYDQADQYLVSRDSALDNSQTNNLRKIPPVDTFSAALLPPLSIAPPACLFSALPHPTRRGSTRRLVLVRGDPAEMALRGGATLRHLLRRHARINPYYTRSTPDRYQTPWVRR